MSLKRLGQIALISASVMFSGYAHAATYYVDYAHGADSNNAMSKGTPWKYAPGMAGWSGTVTPAPGDNIIFKGCVTWPNSAFTWTIKSAGTAGNPIYYGVDKTWWDSTVSGCASAWNRPIFNLGDANPTDSLNRIIEMIGSYFTLDDFEITNIAANGNPINGTTTVFSWDDTNGNITVENMYVHGWHNPYFSVGTGNLTNGSSTVTNFVPYPYSPLPNWTVPCTTGGCNGGIQLQSLGGGIPLGNSTPTVTAISGSNPYSITFTNTAGGATQNCTGCVIQVGSDFLDITGGVERATVNDVMQDNVIDGSDTAEVQLNPSGDCGLSEGNNQFCVASGTAMWRVPNIWRNNVIRYVENGAVGECSEYSGNLIEYVRLSTNPTAHTNFVECLDDNPVSGATLFYNNVMRHGTNPNPNTPTGRGSVGVGAIWYTPKAGEKSYIFNNVFYDVLQNAPFERASSSGTAVIFNNTADCGASWSLTSSCASPIASGDIFQNNNFITSNSSPIGSCSGYACTTNLLQTPSQASALGLLEATLYAYSGPTANGTNIGSYCTQLSGAGLSAAAAACQSDTSYAVSYNTSNHTVIVPGRVTSSRLPTTYAGAYQTGTASASSQPSPPTSLTATVH